METPDKQVLVQKYGGTSLATVDRIRCVAQRIAESWRAGYAVAVVVSAQGRTTDDLLELARSVNSAGSGREIDQLLATGECASAALLALALQSLDIPAVSLSGAQAGVIASGRHGAGVIAEVVTDRVSRLLADGHVVVVAGFQGVNDAGDIVTLGRGGSDTTAVALAAALSARRCEIYTDVDGVYTADPRVVDDVRIQPRVDSAVMAEMAFAGARVLHPRAVELAASQHVEVVVASSFTTGGGGTVISKAPLESRNVLIGVSHDADVARVLIHVRGPRHDPAADILAVLGRHQVPVDLVARSGRHEDEFRMGFTMRRSDLPSVRSALQEVAENAEGSIVVDEQVGKVSLVGTGMLDRPDHMARMIAALSTAGIPTSWISTSQSRISVTTPADRLHEAVELLHREFAPEWSDLPAAASVAS